MENILEVNHLKKYFDTASGTLHAVDDVSFSIKRGHTMGVVGESGCGKSTLGRTIIHLHESTSGKMFFEGEDITDAKGKNLKKLRHDIQMIFQDPYSSLNPRSTVYDTIRDTVKRTDSGLSASQIEEKTAQIMDIVGIDTRFRNAYPHELDGGRRQRVGIGRALAPNPQFIVCDEPVSALDVSIQAQVLNLLQDLQSQMKLTYIFITHDLSVVKHISDEICVMYLGQIVESCSSKELFQSPIHPYTKALLSAIPSTNIHRKRERIILRGEITSPINPKQGCRFAARCIYATEKCYEPQTSREIAPNHFVSCCRAEEING